MTLPRQLRCAFIDAPLAIFRVRGRSARLAGLYVVLSIAVLGALAGLLFAFEGGLRRALLSWLFPTELHGVADFVMSYVLANQTHHVLLNLLVTASLLVVSLVLFRVKERMSAAIEAAHDLAGGRPIEEHPWWVEAFEEVKLLLGYVAAFFVVFWVGHDPAGWRRTLATVLSYAVMFITFAIDFGAPTPMRHRLHYGQIIRALLRRPVAAFGFGAVFSLPLVGVAHLVAASPSLGPVATVAIIFGANVVGIVCAAAGGTWLGAGLLPVAEQIRPTGVASRVVTWTVIAAILAGGSYVATALGQTVATKSQILRCRYDVDWSTLSVAKPSLAGLLGKGEITVGVGFDLGITNPSALPVVLEQNRLEIRDGGVVIATTSLAPLSVPAHGTARARVQLDLTVRATSFLEGARLDPTAWSVTLWLRLDDAIDYPIYIVRGP